MPSATVHLKAACLMKDQLGIKNETQFYIGAIAPDAVNLDGFATQDERYHAHIRSKDYDKWKQNINAFYDEKKAAFATSDYLKGYVFHLYTDIAWDELIQPSLFSFLQKQGCGTDELREQKWQELFRLNGMLSKQDWYAAVKHKLQSALAENDISGGQVRQYLEYIVGDYEREKMLADSPLYLSDNHIFAAAIQATDYAEKLFGT
ncbi:MAG: hypothetical protein IJU04_02600 [Ruminococcus sp.]|nr:hypothetical protein [Ruminococcus sp.]